MGRVIRSTLAQRDLAEIWHYIALDNPTAADGLIDRIKNALDLLGDNPGAGPPHEDIKAGAGLRSFPVQKYLIIYRVVENGIEVARVVHGARDLRALFER